MALQIVEFFGHAPLDPAATADVESRRCPFVNSDCIKPNHGACSVRQVSRREPIICCPNRMYANEFKILKDIAAEAFGDDVVLLSPRDVQQRRIRGSVTGREVAVFGRYWGRELALPKPLHVGTAAIQRYYVDWILAKLDGNGALKDLTAVEVQTVDTTGNYSDQAEAYFEGQPFIDGQGRNPGFSQAGMNWENVNKRILPQIIYKGHVLRLESKCKKGLYFVCPVQVYDRIRGRLGSNLQQYHQSTGAITFRCYELESDVPRGQQRSVVPVGSFTTTVDQVALAFTSPVNLPGKDVYTNAIRAALSQQVH